MTNQVSPSDRRFMEEVESARFPADQFSHRAHIRLAYCYLCESDVDEACARIRRTILGLLAANGADDSKFHVTLTRAWMMAVHHFMNRAPDTASADQFIGHDDRLLDTAIMLTHYTRDRLFSEDAREEFVEPDLDPIPRYPGAPDTPAKP